jgi:hypothetical protein
MERTRKGCMSGVTGTGRDGQPVNHPRDDVRFHCPCSQGTPPIFRSSNGATCIDRLTLHQILQREHRTEYDAHFAKL